MDLTNEFTVDAPIDRAWAVLSDVEPIAPCLPRAKTEGVDGDEYKGVVKSISQYDTYFQRLKEKTGLTDEIVDEMLNIAMLSADAKLGKHKLR